MIDNWRKMFVLVIVAAGWATAATPEVRLPTDPQQEATLLADAGAGFKIKQTTHFVIAYDTDDEVVDKLTNRLEQTCHMVHRFCKINKIEARPLSRRLEVLFFDKRDRYDRYSASLQFPSAGTSGVYFEGSNRSMFLNTANDTGSQELLDSIQAARRDPSLAAQVKRLESKLEAYTDHLTQTVVQHETTHQVMFNVGLHVRGAKNPKWLVEGLATLFETPPGRTGTGITTVNQLRLKDFRTAVSGDREKSRLTAEDYLDAVEARRMASVKRLVCEDELFGLRGSVGATHYANAWAFMYFLQRTYRKELAAYMKDVSLRRPGVDYSPAEELALFEMHFGAINEAFCKRFASFVLKLQYKPPVNGF